MTLPILLEIYRAHAMRNLLVGIAIAAALAGCATSPRRAGEISNSRALAEADPIRACETAIYHSPARDNDVMLRCATILDVWQ